MPHKNFEDDDMLSEEMDDFDAFDDADIPLDEEGALEEESPEEEAL